jgi:hypothetical protein
MTEVCLGVLLMGAFGGLAGHARLAGESRVSAQPPSSFLVMTPGVPATGKEAKKHA